MIHPGDLFLLSGNFKPYGIQLLFYLLFADHKEVWASQNKLAAILGFSVRTVIRTVAQLEGLGIISVKRFQGGEVNRYKLNQNALASFLSQFSVGDGSPEGVLSQDSSSNGSEDPLPSFPPDAPQIPPEASIDVTESTDLSSLQDLSQDASPDLAGNDDKSSGDARDRCLTGNGNETSEAYFDDPHLDLLVGQIEQGRKQGTRLFRWLQSENLLTYWPPTDSYRVEKQLLRQKVATLDELNSILTAPVRPEYDWFVTSFLEGCRDNGYEPQDTSQVFALEINMFLDGMLRPARQGKALWTTASIKAQLKTMIEEWPKLGTWTQLGLPVEQPPEPTLEFFITNTAVWQAARERWIDEKDAKILTLLQTWESARNDGPVTAGG